MQMPDRSRRGAASLIYERRIFHVFDEITVAAAGGQGGDKGFSGKR